MQRCMTVHCGQEYCESWWNQKPRAPNAQDQFMRVLLMELNKRATAYANDNMHNSTNERDNVLPLSAGAKSDKIEFLKKRATAYDNDNMRNSTCHNTLPLFADIYKADTVDSEDEYSVNQIDKKIHWAPIIPRRYLN